MTYVRVQRRVFDLAPERYMRQVSETCTVLVYRGERLSASFGVLRVPETGTESKTEHANQSAPMP